jgi:hypothetical protein
MGEQTPGTLELNCPGCGAYFRLKPKKGRLPEGPIPCPKCRTPIPVVAPSAAAEERAPVEPTPSKAPGAISGEGASQDRGAKRRDDDSLTNFLNSPNNPLGGMLQDEGIGPNSTFLGFQKLPFVERSTRVINPDEMVPEAEIGVSDEALRKDKQGSTTDTSRFLKEEMAAERGDLPMAPHLRNTRENIAVMDQLPSLFGDDDDEEDSLGEMLSQARMGPEGDMIGDGTRMEEAEAGPFDLRDILEAEKQRMPENNEHEVTRNPLLEQGFMPEAEPEKPKDNPWSRASSQTLDDLMGEVDAQKRQSGMSRALSGVTRQEPAVEGPKAEAEEPKSGEAPVQLARLKLGLRRAKEAEVREERAPQPSPLPRTTKPLGGSFDNALSSDDIFSESSSVAVEDSATPGKTAPNAAIVAKQALQDSHPAGHTTGTRTLPLTPVMPAPAVMPTGKLPEEEQEGSAPKESPAPDKAKGKAPPLAALLKRKINPEKLRSLGEGGLGESSSAATDDAMTRVVERPADDAPGFDTSIAEVLRRAEEGLAKQPTRPAHEPPEEVRAAAREALQGEETPTAELDTKPEERAEEPKQSADEARKIAPPMPAALDPLRQSGSLGALKRRAGPPSLRLPEEDLEAGVAPAAIKTTAPHRPLPSITTGEQPALHLPASLAGMPNLTGSSGRGKPRTRQPTEPMFPVAPSGLLSIQPPTQQSSSNAVGLGAEASQGTYGSASQLGMAGERRGSGYIRLPTSEILEVLGQGSYRIMVEDIVYEPVDEQGLTELIKRGVLLGAEQIAEADGDWMPIGEHPVFRRLRRRMALEAHALLAKYRKASEERSKREREASGQSNDELLDMLADDGESSEPQAPPAFVPSAESSESDEELDLWGGSKVLEDSAPAHKALPVDVSNDTAVIEFPSHIDSSGLLPRVQQAPSETLAAAALEAAEAEQLEIEAPVFEAPVAEEPVAEEPSEAQPVAPVEPEPIKPEPIKPETKRPVERPAPAEDDEPIKPSGRGGVVALLLVGLVLVGLVAAVFLVPGLREQLMGSAAQPGVDVVTPTPEPKPTPDPIALVEADAAPDQAPVVAEADQGSDMAEAPVKPAASGVAGLMTQWQAAPADGALAMRLADAQRAEGDARGARRTLLAAMAAGAPEREALTERFKTSLSDADMKSPEPRRIKAGDELDGALAQRLYGRVAIELRKGSEPVGLFFPDVLDEPGNWRSQVAASRLCGALGCPVAIPELVPAYIVDKDLRALKGAISDKQADTDELDWNGEKVDGVDGRPDVLRGVMITWHDQRAAWPTEAANVWRPWLDPATDMDELGAPLTDALSGLERYQGGAWFEPGKAAASDASVKRFAREVAGLLLLDYLIGNWERYARPDQGINAVIEGGQLVALYQGTAFPSRTSSRVKGRFDYFGRYDAAMVEGLRLISPELLDEVLFPEASGAERAGLRVFWERQADALKRIDAQIKRYGAEKVLFSAP